MSRTRARLRRRPARRGRCDRPGARLGGGGATLVGARKGGSAHRAENRLPPFSRLPDAAAIGRATRDRVGPQAGFSGRPSGGQGRRAGISKRPVAAGNGPVLVGAKSRRPVFREWRSREPVRGDRRSCQRKEPACGEAAVRQAPGRPLVVIGVEGVQAFGGAKDEAGTAERARRRMEAARQSDEQRLGRKHVGRDQGDPPHSR